MKKYLVIALLVIGVAGFPIVSKADERTVSAVKAVEVGNKVCPVSGEAIDSDSGMAAVQVEHNGKLYNLCCAMCEGDFKADPAKYSKIADDEVAKEKAN
jgi:YHS domain-containing protein